MGRPRKEENMQEPRQEIEVVNFIAPVPLGHTAEASGSVHFQRQVSGEYVKAIKYDDDKRFIRIECAGGSVDLIPLTNVSGIHLKKVVA